MKILAETDCKNKRIFVRADLDVPVEQSTVHNSQFTEATRLSNLKETVDYLLNNQAAQIIIAGHIDRPHTPDPALSTKQLLKPLEKILSEEIAFVDQLSVNRSQATDNTIVLLENLRFWEGEVANDLDFAKQLAALADIYVNEAFGNCHRAHASMVGLPALLAHFAGFHLEKEVAELSKLLRASARPFVAIVGGVKIETKIPLIENLAQIADSVLVGGELPISIVKNNTHFGQNVILATHNQDKKDIDSLSVRRFMEIIRGAKTLVWNGPMGVFEEGFSQGTLAVAKAIIDTSAFSVVGGGETTQFLANNNLLSRFSFVSAGGGAMLEFLSGRELPALEALN